MTLNQKQTLRFAPILAAGVCWFLRGNNHPTLTLTLTLTPPQPSSPFRFSLPGHILLLPGLRPTAEDPPGGQGRDPRGEQVSGGHHRSLERGCVVCFGHRVQWDGY